MLHQNVKYFVGIVVAALAACDSNESGNVGATKLGDTTHPVDGLEFDSMVVPRVAAQP